MNPPRWGQSVAAGAAGDSPAAVVPSSVLVPAGQLNNRGDRRHGGTFSVATNPQTTVVKGGPGSSASRAVTLK